MFYTRVTCRGDVGLVVLNHLRAGFVRLQIAATRVTVRHDCSSERARVRASGWSERCSAPHACATNRQRRRASSVSNSAGAGGTRKPVASVRHVLVSSLGEVGGRGRLFVIMLVFVVVVVIVVASDEVVV